MTSPTCGWPSSTSAPTSGRIACRTIAPFAEQQQEGAAVAGASIKPASKPRRGAVQHARPRPQPQQKPAGGRVSRHAAACLAAAEAAVSAATAAFAAPPDMPPPTAAPAAAAADGPAAAGGPAIAQQQLQQQQRTTPPLYSPRLAQARAQPGSEGSDSDAAPCGIVVSPRGSRLASPRGVHKQESSLVSVASSLHIGGLQQQCANAGATAAAAPAAPAPPHTARAPASTGQQPAASCHLLFPCAEQQHSWQPRLAAIQQPPARPQSPPLVTLDGALLLAACPGARAPGDVQCADLSSRGISSVAPCDEGSASNGAAPALLAFRALTRLQLDDNRLACIAGLAALPALQQLAVSANRLRSLADLAELQQQQQQQKQLQAPLLEALSEGAAVNADDGESDAGNATAAAAAAAAATAAAATASRAAATSAALPRAAGFSHLQVLNVSFNAIPAEQLLGRASPLATLPSLRELHAAGNGLALLPACLGPFCSLALLDLSHNKLRGGPALLSLLSLPALQQLSLGHNPLSALPTPASGVDAARPAPCCSRLLRLDLSHSRVARAEQLLPLLQLAPQLQLLNLAHTPLGARCALDRQPPAHIASVLLQLQRPGLQVITQAGGRQQQGPKSRRGGASSRGSGQRRGQAGARLLPVTVEEAVAARHVLAAASRQAIASLPHALLVAAFERVSAGIDVWQLPTVPEDSMEWLEQQQQETKARQQQQELQLEQNDEPLVDNTFITGVGIVGQLPQHGSGFASDADDGETLAAAAAPDASSSAWQDPTERLAVALGLQVTQLAHYTHQTPANPDGALHRLRHALAHPLVVDAAAGERPQQHHAALTASAAGKQRPRKLLPLPQPIPLALDTRVAQSQAIDGLLSDMRGRLQELEATLLQQLQSQAGKLTACAQEMTSSAAAEAGLLAAAADASSRGASGRAQAIEADAEAR